MFWLLPHGQTGETKHRSRIWISWLEWRRARVKIYHCPFINQQLDLLHESLGIIAFARIKTWVKVIVKLLKNFIKTGSNSNCDGFVQIWCWKWKFFDWFFVANLSKKHKNNFLQNQWILKNMKKAIIVKNVISQ